MSIPGIKTVSIGIGSRKRNSWFKTAWWIIQRIQKQTAIKKNQSCRRIEEHVKRQSYCSKSVMKPIPLLKTSKINQFVDGKSIRSLWEDQMLCCSCCRNCSEGMLSIVLLQTFLEKIRGDSLEETKQTSITTVLLIKKGKALRIGKRDG